MSKSYVIISPCRNEGEYMKNTLDSVLSQTVLPDLWVIVNDGSTDDTAEILDEYKNKYSFIRVVNKANRGYRSVGPGVIDAFYEGLKIIELSDYKYICKLDLDLVLPEKYFETLTEKMEANPRLGACSGKPYFKHPINGKLISEKLGDEAAGGFSKFYRVSCFLQIGGFVRQVIWDGIDAHKSRQLGWLNSSWDEDGIRCIHLRPMGSSQKNIIEGRVRVGFGQYFMGTSLVYMSAVSVYRMSRRPLVIGGIAMFWGYIKNYLTGTQKLEDEELIKFIRKYQWNCLLKGKKRATAELNEKQEHLWNPETKGKLIYL